MTVTANIHEAKTTLSKLIERALAGEEVVIAKAGRPLVRLNPIQPEKQAGKRQFGQMRGRIWYAEDWNSPETNGEVAKLFYESEIDPSDDTDPKD